jgi:hypothetical protein
MIILIHSLEMDQPKIEKITEKAEITNGRENNAKFSS